MTKLIKKYLLLVFVFVLSLTAQAQTPSQVPTDESIETLLQVTDVEGVLKTSLADADKLYNDLLKNMLAKAESGLNEEEQKIMDESIEKTTTIWLGMVGWDALKPKMVTVYKQIYTQEEVDAMIAFYQTPVGRSIISKQVETTRLITNLMMEDMQKAAFKIMEIQEETTQKLKAVQKDSHSDNK